MLRRSFRFGLLVGVLVGAVAAAVKAAQRQGLLDRGGGETAPAPWTPLPDAEPVVVPTREPAAGKTAASPPKPAPVAPWVEPVDGECPVTHPIKAKLSSGIYHQPGGLNYDRTHPDRCYVDAAAAEADGLRPAKR
ncbi:MAG TPA: hypothetical protein VM262_03075 [Acidimicrobiales bacterium]|nr:hypothetical protein [Acidimicrobiales bacterium]